MLGSTCGRIDTPIGWISQFTPDGVTEVLELEVVEVASEEIEVVTAALTVADVTTPLQEDAMPREPSPANERARRPSMSLFDRHGIPIAMVPEDAVRA